MESVVEAQDPADRARLLVALGELAEQDPFIRVRQDPDLHETSVSLYGEVQKEVIRSVLADDYGIEAGFRETTTIHVERPVRCGEAVELLTSDANPHMATLALRVEPGPVGSGVQFRLDVDQRSVPLYIYKTKRLFIDHMTEYICRALRRGLYGWEVTDCAVTLTKCDYYIGDGPTKPNTLWHGQLALIFETSPRWCSCMTLEQAGTVSANRCYASASNRLQEHQRPPERASPIRCSR